MTTEAAARRVVHAIRARSDGERHAHCSTRRAFLVDIVADARTRDLFGYWWASTGVRGSAEALIVALDDAARRHGCPDRATFIAGATLDQLCPQERDELRRLWAQVEGVLTERQHERCADARGFIVAELYGTLVDEEVPIRGWLAMDLLSIFHAQVVTGLICGQPVRLAVPLSPSILHALKKGQVPKHAGAHLEQWAHWYYRRCVARPRATWDELATEYHDTKADEDVYLAPRDSGGLDDRPDTKLIRHGVEEADRLLRLAVPPEQWAPYFAEFWPGRGGKTLM